MTEIVLICRKCGPLERDKCTPNSKPPKIRYRCKQCKIEANKRYSEKYKAEIQDKNLAYYHENAKDVRASQKKWRKNNKEKWNALNKACRIRRREKDPEKYKAWQRSIYVKNKIEMNNTYVRHLLYTHHKFNQKEIPDEIVDIKRAVVAIRRKMRNYDIEEDKQKLASLKESINEHKNS